MKALRFTAFVAALGISLAAFVGCGKHHADDGHKHGEEHAGGKGDEHDHEESPSGASFKPGKGVILTDETRRILDLQTADVTERKFSPRIHFNLQVFDEIHRHDLKLEDHAGCDVHGSAFLASENAAMVRTGMPVEVQSRSNGLFLGSVIDIRKDLAIGESEIIVGISNATTQLQPGDFLNSKIILSRDRPVIVIPRPALLRTSEGTFVYAVNGSAFFRTAVKVGAESDGLLEITDGLLEGDSVVTKPVETLYLIELRATKGGGHSH